MTTPSIAAAHAYLADEILQGLEISSPVQARIKKAYRYFPRQGIGVPDYPCAYVTFEQRTVNFGPALLHKPYTMHIQVFVAPMEDDTAPEKAANFMDAIVTKLAESADSIRLGGAVSLIQSLRGEAPETLTVLERAGKAFIGLDLYLDVQITTTPGYSA